MLARISLSTSNLDVRVAPLTTSWGVFAGLGRFYGAFLLKAITEEGPPNFAKYEEGPRRLFASMRDSGLPPESWRLPLCGPRLDGRDLFVFDGWQQAGRTVSAP